VTERAAALADRADRLPEVLDEELAARLREATRGQLESAQALEQALEPAGDALRTLERSDGDSDSRRPLRRAGRALTQVEVAIAPAGERFGTALVSLRGAFEGLEAELAREGELDGPVQMQLAEAEQALRQLEVDSMADFGETRTRVARLEDRAGEAIEAIDRKVAAERRAERRRSREEEAEESEASPSDDSAECPSGETLLPGTGCYDPTPPPAGDYGDMEEFCRDQPEETECGGPGDPRGP
jgi:hypothetical protein